MRYIRNRISDAWHDGENDGLLVPLFIVSILYRGIIGLRNLLYDKGVITARKLGCKVISVGNITVGGTGKTPMVIMLAKLLKKRGYRPVVLSRGYAGRKKGRVNIVSDGKHILMDSEEAGEEPALIAKSVDNVPVITGKKRYVTGKYAIEQFGADILILDDAFQHRSLARDVDMVLLDDRRPAGNGFMIPRGNLREPPDSLERADLVIFTGTEIQEDLTLSAVIAGRHKIARHLSDKCLFRAYRRPKDVIKGNTDVVYPLEYIQGKKIVAFAGTATPHHFRKTVASAGGEVVDFLSFPDHHSYTSDDVVKIEETFHDSSAHMILTTEKDGIKLVRFPELLRDVFIVRIGMEIISLQEEFENTIMGKLGA